MNNFYIKSTNYDSKNFCAMGQEDYIDKNGDPRIEENDSDKIAAKIIFNKKSRQVNQKDLSKSYFIKINPKMEVFNPIELLSSVNNKQTNHFIENTCKSEWFFKEVDMHVFNKYLNFLKLKNVKLIKDIQRDLK